MPDSAATMTPQANTGKTPHCWIWLAALAYPIKAISRAKGIDNRKGTAGTYKEVIITDR